MVAVLTKINKSGIKTISGDVIQNGMGYITLAIIDKSGSKQIKRYKTSDYTVRIH
jgi:hypothetical protein